MGWDLPVERYASVIFTSKLSGCASDRLAKEPILIGIIATVVIA